MIVHSVTTVAVSTVFIEFFRVQLIMIYLSVNNGLWQKISRLNLEKQRVHG